MNERADAEAGGDAPVIVPSGTPVVGADGEPVGHVVAAEPGGLLVAEAGATGGDDAHLHVPQGTVAEVGEQGVVLATTGEAAMAMERERAELAALLRRAHLTPDRVRLLRALLAALGAPPTDPA